MTDATWLWWLPALPLLGSVICGVLHFMTLKKRAHDPREAGYGTIAAWTAVAAMASAFVLALVGFQQLAGAEDFDSIRSNVWHWIDGGSIQIEVALVLDHLSSLMTLVILGVGTLIHVYSVGYMKGDPGYAKFFAYLNLFVAMMLILVLSSSLLGLFVGWEGVGLCSYLLIGFWYEKGWPAEAGQKAFVVNRIGDAFFLVGTFILVSLFGTLDMQSIGAGVQGLMETHPGTLTLAALCLFGGACGKSAQLPLFTWLPDAMAGPTPVSALIHAATMVTSGVYLIVRLNPLFAASPGVMYLIAAVGVATAFIAGSTALVQRDLKKVLAYSTVSQLGYMFLALGCGAWTAAVFHLVTHAFFKGLLFLGAGSVIHGMHDEQDMHRMGGLRKHMPRTFLTFTVGAAALSGLPLLSGYFSKDEILFFTFAQGGGYWVLWALGIVTAAMTAYYSWRMVALTFFGDERFDKEHVHPHESPSLMTIPLIILAVLSLLGGALNLPHVQTLHHWLEPVTAIGTQILEEAGAAAHPGTTLEVLLLVFGAMIALVFAHIGFHGHRHGLAGDERFQVARPGAARLFEGAWGIDRAYSTWVVQPLKLLAFMIAVVVDQFIIDGIVNGAGRLACQTGERVRKMTDGSIATYGLWMGGVTAGLAILWMWMGNA